MKNLASLIVVIMAMVSLPRSSSANTLDDWNKALDAYMQFADNVYANDAEGAAVLQALPASSPCDGSNTEIPDLMIDSDYFKSIAKKAYAGNKSAAEIMFRLRALVCGDAAHSEFMDISLGHLIRPQPGIFLSLLDKSGTTRLNRILGNLGESFVDQSSKKVQELQLRYDALASVKDAPAIQQKCLEQLKKMIGETKGQ